MEFVGNLNETGGFIRNRRIHGNLKLTFTSLSKRCHKNEYISVNKKKPDVKLYNRYQSIKITDVKQEQRHRFLKEKKGTTSLPIKA